MSTVKHKFTVILADQYKQLFETQDYALAASRYTPSQLAEKMASGLLDGSANIDGDGIKRTCKALGIKPTYKAIKEFLNRSGE
jgi:hypothetical protein